MPGVSRDYASHFQAGTRVRIGVPLPDGAIFQEWAKVASLLGDLLEVDLSRDSLPQQATLERGRVVQVGVLDRNKRVGCNGRIAGWNERRRLVLHLHDEVAPFEPREFYRQDLRLPLDYRLPPSQFLHEIQERWRQCRWAIEFASQEPAAGEAVELTSLREDIHARLEQRKAAPLVNANVSGGGLRLNVGERLHPGMLVELGIYLPQPKKVLEIVGEVVQVTASSGEDGFNTAFRYRFIDEADRDRLIGYIASQQLWQLSQQAPKTELPSLGRKPKALGPLRIAIAILVLVGFVGCEVRTIMLSREKGEKHEIEKVFEAGIMEYLRQRR